MACADGTISYYDAQKQLTSLERDAQCREHHGGIVKVEYCDKSKLLVVAFENGKVHIRKCVHGLKSHFAWRESCLSLSDPDKEIFDLECLLLSSTELECPVFELWFGVDASQIEVWRMPDSPTQVWSFDTVSRIRTISHVRVGQEEEGVAESGAVHHVCKSVDQRLVAGVWHTGRKSEVQVGIISVLTKQCLRTISLQESGE